MLDEKYFDSIVAYLPEDAKAILNSEVPRIRQQVIEEVQKFGEEVGKSLQEKIDALIAERGIESEVELLKKKLTDLKGDPSGALASSVETLKAELDEFKAKWKGVGKSLHEAAVLAVRSFGIPLPPGLV